MVLLDCLSYFSWHILLNLSNLTNLPYISSFDSALVKLMNKSIEGTADDEEEGVSPDSAIRSGLELLKVFLFGNFVFINFQRKISTFFLGYVRGVLF